eukprot:1145079-Pelagomonas_calceolata.AAC.2
MEGAAQGGMIVCEQDVAMRAAEAWAATQPSAEPEQALGPTLHTVHSWSPFQVPQSYLVSAKASAQAHGVCFSLLSGSLCLLLGALKS